MRRRAGADGLHGEAGLLGELGRGVFAATGVGRDHIEVGGFANQIERAQSFPGLVVGGPDGGEMLALSDTRAIRHKPAIQRPRNLRANFYVFPCVDVKDSDVSNERAGIHGLIGLEARLQNAGSGRVNGGGFEHGDDDVVAGRVVEADEREGGVAANGEVGIVQHGEKRGVEFGRLVVLAHGPCGHGANGRFGIRRERDDLRVEALDGRIVSDDAVGDLREAVLDVVRIAFGLEDVGELRVGERAAEPGGAPEKKRHQDEKQREREDDERPALAERGAPLWCGCRRTAQVGSLP